jgi:hypothetical protein
LIYMYQTFILVTKDLNIETIIWSSPLLVISKTWEKSYLIFSLKRFFFKILSFIIQFITKIHSSICETTHTYKKKVWQTW